ncbi:hypothetical protein [Cohnella fermenti]|uniref:Uncharacterized protein n=1 Tax=Cohnella fermenti TaxID=2565925 RepID=A0A4S4BYV1_9BACL|nr:hypothetical protein [Cohnella fermenti]THF78367.1 hypothetical protein E6C55_14225 [Cohnella fermenti]
MSYVKAGLLLAAVSLAAVVALGQLARLSAPAEARGAPHAVFAPMSVQTLSQESIVDAFAALPLETSIRRLLWESGILTVDLTVQAGKNDASAVWRDAATLVDLSFVKVHNVRQLLVRVFGESSGIRQLLFSADTRAADWTAPELAGLRTPGGGAEPAWAPKIRPDWTRAGEGWRRSVANS